MIEDPAGSGSGSGSGSGVAAAPGEPLRLALLRALAEVPSPEGVSLPRLAKRFGVGASVVMRELAPLGEAHIGGVAGPGWVHVAQLGGDRWSAQITEAGRAALAEVARG